MLGTYTHYKGGRYRVEGSATHTETGEELTIYQDEKGYTWARPSAMFFGKVEINGVLVDRFYKDSF